VILLRSVFSSPLRIQVTTELTGKPGHVRDFGPCQDFTRSPEVSGEKFLSWKNGQKLSVVSCIYAASITRQVCKAKICRKRLKPWKSQRKMKCYIRSAPTLSTFKNVLKTRLCSRSYFTDWLFRRVRAVNIVRRPCSDSSHVTAPYKLSFYYYLLLYQCCKIELNIALLLCHSFGLLVRRRFIIINIIIIIIVNHNKLVCWSLSSEMLLQWAESKYIRVACNNSHFVSEISKLFLLETYRLPLISYSCEAFSYNSRQLSRLKVCWNNAYSKIFRMKIWRIIESTAVIMWAFRF